MEIYGATCTYSRWTVIQSQRMSTYNIHKPTIKKQSGGSDTCSPIIFPFFLNDNLLEIIQLSLCNSFERNVIAAWSETLTGKKASFTHEIYLEEDNSHPWVLVFTYTVLYMEFLHKNKPLTVFLWDSWSLWLPEWPVPLLGQEPTPGKKEKTKM